MNFFLDTSETVERMRDYIGILLFRDGVADSTLKARRFVVVGLFACAKLASTDVVVCTKTVLSCTVNTLQENSDRQ